MLQTRDNTTLHSRLFASSCRINFAGNKCSSDICERAELAIPKRSYIYSVLRGIRAVYGKGSRRTGNEGMATDKATKRGVCQFDRKILLFLSLALSLSLSLSLSFSLCLPLSLSLSTALSLEAEERDEGHFNSPLSISHGMEEINTFQALALLR